MNCVSPWYNTTFCGWLGVQYPESMSKAVIRFAEEINAACIPMMMMMWGLMSSDVGLTYLGQKDVSRPQFRVLCKKWLKGHFLPLLLTVGEPAICDDQRRGEPADHQRHGSLDQRSGPCPLRLLHRLLPCPHLWWHPLAGMITLLTRAWLQDTYTFCKKE